MKAKHNSIVSTQEKYFLDTFLLIKQLASRRLHTSEREEIEDIAQEVKLGLLIWKRNRPDGQYTPEEWLKIANTATRNEIQSFYAKRLSNTVSLSNCNESDDCLAAKELLPVTRLEGNTNMELHSLLVEIWKIILNQSLIEKYALLLKNSELAWHLLSYRGCNIKEMAEGLRLTETELEETLQLLPLKYKEIAELLKDKLNLPTTPEALRKARQRATAELKTATNQLDTTGKNGKSSGIGKTRIVTERQPQRR